MAEYWFYHLEASPVEAVLPNLLEKTLERGWRALVKLPMDGLKAMDDHLWTYRDQSFLPHGRDDEPMTAYQPVVLSAEAETAEGFQAVFLVGGEEVTDMSGVERCLVMINGRSEEATKAARTQWKLLKDAGETISYWQQVGGRWDKKA